VTNSTKKIAIFVDVQNIYYTSRHTFAKHFHYQKFWDEIAAQGDIVAAYAYAIDRGDTKQAQFQQILRGIGFEVKLKPFIQRRDGSAKGDWDVGITIDVLAAAPDVDIIVLASGDGDFALLLDAAREKHQCQSHVYGVDKLTAAGLIDSCDYYRQINSSLLM
jgi:uncharacterized LabA/DUF88 family protein